MTCTSTRTSRRIPRLVRRRDLPYEATHVCSSLRDDHWGWRLRGSSEHPCPAIRILDGSFSWLWLPSIRAYVQRLLVLSVPSDALPLKPNVRLLPKTRTSTQESALVRRKSASRPRFASGEDAQVVHPRAILGNTAVVQYRHAGAIHSGHSGRGHRF